MPKNWLASVGGYGPQNSYCLSKLRKLPDSTETATNLFSLITLAMRGSISPLLPMQVMHP